jgi:hypothetical protein
MRDFTTQIGLQPLREQGAVAGLRIAFDAE